MAKIYNPSLSGGGGGTATWGTIIGTLSNQTDLSNALNAKAEYPTQTGNNGKFLQTDGSTVSWQSAGASATWGSITGTLSSQTDLSNALSAKAEYPTQTGNNGKFLQTDGSSTLWMEQQKFFDATVGAVGSDYATIGDAISAGKKSLLLQGSTTETADITLPNGFYAYSASKYTINLGGYRLLVTNNYLYKFDNLILQYTNALTGTSSVSGTGCTIILTNVSIDVNTTASDYTFFPLTVTMNIYADTLDIYSGTYNNCFRIAEITSGYYVNINTLIYNVEGNIINRLISSNRNLFINSLIENVISGGTTQFLYLYGVIGNNFTTNGTQGKIDLQFCRINNINLNTKTFQDNKDNVINILDIANGTVNAGEGNTINALNINASGSSTVTFSARTIVNNLKYIATDSNHTIVFSSGYNVINNNNTNFFTKTLTITDNAYSNTYRLANSGNKTYEAYTEGDVCRLYMNRYGYAMGLSTTANRIYLADDTFKPIGFNASDIGNNNAPSGVRSNIMLAVGGLNKVRVDGNTDIAIGDYLTLMASSSITTGTVTFTDSSTTVTGTGTNFTSADVGKFIQHISSGVVYLYTITAVTSTTELTIHTTPWRAIVGTAYEIHTRGILRKASSGDMAIAIAQEAYSTNNANGYISSYIIQAREV